MVFPISPPAKRPYRSPLRAQQARLTIDGIVSAAAKLFADNGYIAVSIDAVAEAASVSRATVFGSVGGKATLIKEAYRRAIAQAVGGEGDGTPLMRRPRSDEIRALGTATEYLMAYAVLCTTVSAHMSGIYEAIREAARADPEVAALWDTIGAERRLDATTVVADVKARTPLRGGLDEAIAADIIWVFNDPGIFHMLVHRRGWPVSRFAAWMSHMLISELLGR